MQRQPKALFCLHCGKRARCGNRKWYSNPQLDTPGTHNRQGAGFSSKYNRERGIRYCRSARRPPSKNKYGVAARVYTYSGKLTL